MEVDWAFAFQIGGLGFGLVFAVLILLAGAMWLTGLALRKIGADRDKTGDKTERE